MTHKVPPLPILGLFTLPATNWILQIFFYITSSAQPSFANTWIKNFNRVVH
jgi:hypothetical protein